MEAKNKKNVWKFYSLMIITILSTGFFLQSCRNVDDSMNNGEDLPYLTLSEDISNLDIDYYNLSKADLNVFGQAFKRIQVIQKDGKYEMNVTSGRQINVSENLFNVFKKLLETTNERNKERIKPENFNLRSKGEEDYTGPTDCVAYAIADVLRSFKYEKSVGEIDSLIRQEYGNNGVPYDHFYEIMSYYLKGDPAQVENGYDSEEMDEKYIIVIGNTENIGHAVILLRTMNNSAMYRDPQNGNEIGICSLSDIVMAYMAIAAA